MNTFERLLDDLKLNDNNKIVMGVRYLVWDYSVKRWAVYEYDQYTDKVAYLVDSYKDIEDALFWLRGAIE